MKKIIKNISMILFVLLLIIIGIVGYVKLALPNVGAAPTVSINKTDARVARGEYLANHVTICMDCHSTRDWSRFSGPPKEGTLGMGGELFDHRLLLMVFYYKLKLENRKNHFGIQIIVPNLKLIY